MVFDRSITNVFGTQETLESVAQALSDFRSRASLEHKASKHKPSKPDLTDLEALAKIYNCTIVLISEERLLDNLHYQFINEPVAGALELVSLAQAADVVEDTKDAEDVEQSGSAHVTPKEAPQNHHMVLYTAEKEQYQPIAAPLNATLQDVKAGLLSLSSKASEDMDSNVDNMMA